MSILRSAHLDSQIIASLSVLEQPTASLLLFLRQLLLPIQDQLPDARCIGLPDLEEMSGRCCLTAGIEKFAIIISEIAAAAHVAGNDFKRHARLLGPEELGAGLL